MSDTVVIIPCHNEADRFNLPAYSSFLSHAKGVQLLLVNDGSTDATNSLHERLREQHPHCIQIHNLICNAGKAEAVRQGVLMALQSQPEFVGYFDADLATPLDEIDRLREVLLQRPEVQLVMGSRVGLLGHRIEREFSRQVLGRCFAIAVSALFGVRMFDTQCGAKLFRCGPAVNEIFRQPFCSRWIFDVELLARLNQLHRRHVIRPIHQVVTELPLREWRDVAGSKLKPADFFKALVELRTICDRYDLIRRRRSVAWTAHIARSPRDAGRSGVPGEFQAADLPMEKAA